ncbi:hypothetical protein CR513_52038, partial [Mucuna pruriens]
MLLAQLDEVPHELTLGFFMNGLNGVIRGKVRTHNSQSDKVVSIPGGIDRPNFELAYEDLC